MNDNGRIRRAIVAAISRIVMTYRHDRHDLHHDVSASWEYLWNPWYYHSTLIVLRGLRGTLKCAPITTLRGKRHALKKKRVDLKKKSTSRSGAQPSERLARAPLRSLPKTHRTSSQWYRGVSGGPVIGILFYCLENVQYKNSISNTVIWIQISIWMYTFQWLILGIWRTPTTS